MHVDARDYSHNDIGNLIRVYAKIEPALLKCIAKSRRTNHYCEPCGEQMLERLANGGHLASEKKTALCVYGNEHKNLSAAKRDKYDDARYSALNLHSWIYRGSVECRLHHGTCGQAKGPRVGSAMGIDPGLR